MKKLIKALLFLIISGTFAHQPILAHASEGGGGGDGGGSDRVKANPEEDQAPSGFSKGVRAYRAMTISISPVQMQLLKSQGYVSESEQRESGNNAWQNRASQQSQEQWAKHGATAYDMAVRHGGISLVDANAMAAQQANVGVSSALANTAWSMASSQRRSRGESVGSGLGAELKADNAFTQARQSTALKNQVAK